MFAMCNNVNSTIQSVLLITSCFSLKLMLLVIASFPTDRLNLSYFRKFRSRNDFISTGCREDVFPPDIIRSVNVTKNTATSFQLLPGSRWGPQKVWGCRWCPQRSGKFSDPSSLSLLRGPADTDTDGHEQPALSNIHIYHFSLLRCETLCS